MKTIKQIESGKMKREVITMGPLEMLNKIENIEKEIMDLKMTVLKIIPYSNRKVISLKGILKGINVSDKDLAKAKKSLYSKKRI